MHDIFSFEDRLPESEESEEEDVGDIVSHKYKPEGTLLTDNLYLTFRDRQGKLTNHRYKEVRRVERHHKYRICHKAIDYINANTDHAVSTPLHL
jgi:hypothetical protein